MLMIAGIASRVFVIASFVGLLAIAPTLHGEESADVPIAIVGAIAIHPEPGAAGESVADTTIVIRGHRIVSVTAARDAPLPPGAKIIDGHGKWVIPGLIDAHVHFFQSGNLYARPDIADFTAWMPFAQETARNKARLPVTFKAWLASGVTSVLDIGGPLWNFEVRERAREATAA